MIIYISIIQQFYSHIASAIIPVTSIIAVPSASQCFPRQKLRANEEWGPLATTILNASLTNQMLIPSSDINQNINDNYQVSPRRTPIGRMDASTDDDRYFYM